MFKFLQQHAKLDPPGGSGVKKANIAIGIASLLIAACMVYLLKSGISLAPAVLIKPSHYSSEAQIAESVAMRLFPQLNEYPSWQVHGPLNPFTDLIVEKMKLQHPRVLFERQDMTLGNESLPRADTPILYIERFPSSTFELSSDCHSMKRLNYRCFVNISLHKSRRKMKADGKKYFLMTSYLERHFLLLVE